MEETLEDGAAPTIYNNYHGSPDTNCECKWVVKWVVDTSKLLYKLCICNSWRWYSYLDRDSSIPKVSRKMELQNKLEDRGLRKQAIKEL